uniref:Pseudouridylate synthase RPUSD4, mitochondrial n=1 Tax=Steinernema glaseri TaxID=37863 RepID=A0A1I8A4Z0_9BILA
MMTERVLYEDESIVAIDKPYQMAYSGAKSGQAQLDRLLTRLAQRIAPESGKLHVVRTLDKQTTGIVLFAKNLERQAQLRDAYEEGRVEQRYRCLVKGIPDEEKAKISIPLVKLIKGRDMHLEPVKNPRTELNVYNVSTEYHIVNSNSTNCALLGATVSKDISHQIRAHLSYGAGCTLIGDKKYNLKDRNVPPRISPTAMTRLNLKPNQFRHLPMFMHLNQLLIPRGGPGSKYISIRAPVPHAFYYVLNKLRLLKK